MNTKPIRLATIYFSMLLALLCLSIEEVEAQRLQRGASRGNRAAAPSRGRQQARPVARPATANRGTTNRSINGGSRQMPNRNVSSANHTRDRQTNINNSRNTNIRNNSSRDRNTNISGNRVNIDNSRNNVNININNNRNTVVRRNPRPYVRPPYRYGGFHFYAYRPYYYHPYRPFYWGPVWHPWGFFVATLAATAIIITIENQRYHYDQGVYYVESNGGYTVVQAPVGATIKVLPEGSETVVVNETTNNYYYGGTYYEKDDGGYTVVPPTSGTVVENLPEGGEEVKAGDITYVKYGDTYYQPVQVDGKDMYEVVDVQEAEEDSE